MTSVLDSQFARTLLNENVVSRVDLEQAAQTQVIHGGTLDTILLEMNLCELSAAETCLSSAWKTAQVPSAKRESVGPHLATTIPARLAESLCLCPLEIDNDGALHVLCLSPLDPDLLSEIGGLVQKRLVPHVLPETLVREGLSRVYKIEFPPRFASLLHTTKSDDVPSPPNMDFSDEQPALEEFQAADLSLGEAMALLQSQTNRDELSEVAVRFARQFLPFGAICGVRDQTLLGWYRDGPAASAQFTATAFPIPNPSIVSQVLEARAPLVVRPDIDEGSALFFGWLGRRRPLTAVFVPVIVAGRCIALYYADGGIRSHEVARLSELVSFGAQIGPAFEGLLRRKRAQATAALSDGQQGNASARTKTQDFPFRVPAQERTQDFPFRVPEQERTQDFPFRVPAKKDVAPSLKFEQPTESPPPLPKRGTKKRSPEHRKTLDSDLPFSDQAEIDADFSEPTLPQFIVALPTSDEDSKYSLLDDVDASDVSMVPPPSLDAASGQISPQTEMPTPDPILGDADFGDTPGDTIHDGGAILRQSPLSDDLLNAFESAEADASGAGSLPALIADEEWDDVSLDAAHAAELTVEVDAPVSPAGMPLPPHTDQSGEHIEEDPVLVGDEEGWLPVELDAAHAATLATAAAVPVQTSPPRGEFGKVPFTDAPKATHNAPSNTRLTELVEQLASDDPDQVRKAIVELKGIGLRAVPALREHFPGKLRCDPMNTAQMVQTAAELGPMIEVLEDLGRAGIDAAIPYLDAPVSTSRFAATFLFVLVPDARAVSLLRPRLYDAEKRIAQVATAAMSYFIGHSHLSDVLVGLRKRLSSAVEETRVRVITLLGNFRDVESLPELMKLLDAREKRVARAARLALNEITLQDFGSRRKNWLKWWETARKKDRVEWLLAGLHSRDAMTRFIASNDLMTISGKDYGFKSDAPRRDRELATVKYERWWKRRQESSETN